MSDHIAIMSNRWDLIPAIVNGEKTVESRWLKSRAAPWDRVQVGDTIYFKSSGGPVTAAARVAEVLQFKNPSPEQVAEIIEKYADQISLPKNELKDWALGKNYCILMRLESAREIESFTIDKTGFGSATAWLPIWDVNRVKLRPQT